jgi:hypothetical protein
MTGSTLCNQRGRVWVTVHGQCTPVFNETGSALAGPNVTSITIRFALVIEYPDPLSYYTKLYK